MVTLADVRRAIDPEEPDYEGAAASLGFEAMPYLAELAVAEDAMIASKAVSLAGMIGGPEAVPILDDAAEASPPEIRVVAAVAAGRLGPAGEEVLLRLLKDGDPGVRKYAVRSIRDRQSDRFRELLQRMQASDSDLGVRRVVTELLQNQ